MSLLERLSITEWSDPGHCGAVVPGTPFSVKTNPWLLKWSEKTFNIEIKVKNRFISTIDETPLHSPSLFFSFLPPRLHFRRRPKLLLFDFNHREQRR